MSATHRWTTTSSHMTSEGWVRYQRCACGETRVLLNFRAGRNDPGAREVGMTITCRGVSADG